MDELQVLCLRFVSPFPEGGHLYEVITFKS